MDIKLKTMAKGTRLLSEDDARLRRKLLDFCAGVAQEYDFSEIVLPAIERFDLYEGIGEEVVNQMFVFDDKGGRKLCLRPEGTATCRELARTTFKPYKDVKIYYETRCWRYERPQAGRYREFTQFGVEILNPTKDYSSELIDVAEKMLAFLISPERYDVLPSVKRGLAYYEGEGFEIVVPELGAQKQIVGGGPYAEGIGFAVGIDRLMLAVTHSRRQP